MYVLKIGSHLYLSRDGNLTNQQSEALRIDPAVKTADDTAAQSPPGLRLVRLRSRRERLQTAAGSW